MDLKPQAKQIARNLLGELRSAASRQKFEDPSIDEEDYFRKIANEFLHNFALEVTTIVGLPNGLDVFKSFAFKEKNNGRKDETKKLN